MKKFKLLIILLLIASLLGCTAVPAPISTQADPAESAATAGTSVSSASSLLTVHYLDVGQADCMLLECDGEYLLIDGGNVDDSSLVVSYLEQTGVETLSAVVCSHAHEDHVGGLAGVLSVFPTEAVYAPTRTYSSRCFDDWCDDVRSLGGRRQDRQRVRREV